MGKLYKKRLIPLIWALIDLAIAAAIFFYWYTEQYGFWWWIRGIVVAFFLVMSLQSFGIAFFASDRRVRRTLEGDFSDRNLN